MALIPFDIAISGLNSIAGILGATEKNRQRQRMLDEAARQQAIVLQGYVDRSKEARREFQSLEQDNAFNPKAEEDFIVRDVAEGLGTNLGNQYAWLRGLGYKPEDAPLTLGAKKLTADSALKAEERILAARNAARERRRQALADLNAVQNQEAQFRSGLGSSLYQQGASIPGNSMETMIGNIISGGLGKRIEEEYFKKKVPGVGATATSNPSFSESWRLGMQKNGLPPSFFPIDQNFRQMVDNRIKLSGIE